MKNSDFVNSLLRLSMFPKNFSEFYLTQKIYIFQTQNVNKELCCLISGKILVEQ